MIPNYFSSSNFVRSSLESLIKDFLQKCSWPGGAVVLDAGPRLRFSIMGSNPRPFCHLQGSLDAKIKTRPYQARRNFRSWVQAKWSQNRPITAETIRLENEKIRRNYNDCETYFSIAYQQKRTLKTNLFITVIQYACTSKKVTQKCNI
jgi:hypothetical protein